MALVTSVAALQLAVSAFDKSHMMLIIFHSLKLILRELTAKEIACLYCRVGWLKIFNPLKVEGSYELDISIWEERQVIMADDKMLHQ
jgi:hypothetical protein